MSKKVLILSSSPRRAGNSDLLCDAFMQGAADAGNQVDKIFLRDRKVSPCVACDYCQRGDGQCAIKDDMAEILAKMQAADVIVLASPIYYYSICAQLKVIIDRTYCCYKHNPLANKELYYILTAAEESETVMDAALACCHGFAVCLPNAAEKGSICAKGVHDAGAVRDTGYLAEAYEMGKGI